MLIYELKLLEDIEYIDNEVWLPVLTLYSFNSKWEKVKKYTFKEGYCYVSSCGRFIHNGKLVSNKLNFKGYYVTSLLGKRFKLHQIVMQTFYPEGIRDGYSVDHINRFNTKDNSLSNLRWASREIQYRNRDNSQNHSMKKVKCLNNGVIYNSCREAELLLGLPRNTVAHVARGERKHSHSYIFIYIN